MSTWWPTKVPTVSRARRRECVRSGPAAIRVRGLTKRFGRRLALAGVDLEIRGRQIVGVVGPDGAGKTTLLRSLAGLLEIEAEVASVLGYDLRGDVTELKTRIGYVPQSFSLQRELSVLENLRFTARLHRMPRARFAERVGELLEHTGLAPFVDRPAGQLSGGMRQKLAVANALLAEPELLLLDEPTAGVDAVARREIWELLEREAARGLVVLSTGYIEEAAACDRLVYLEGGRLVAAGTPEELRRRAAVEVYRAWGDDPQAIARAARSLPWVAATRAVGPSARIEVGREASPGPGAVLAALSALPGAPVRFAEVVGSDMEAALVALARTASP